MDYGTNTSCRWRILNYKINLKEKAMFKLFKKKSELDILNSKYRKLLEESHKFSNINRRLSDEKIAEAAIILDKIKRIEKVQFQA
jgi:hypothetical protein